MNSGRFNIRAAFGKEYSPKIRYDSDFFIFVDITSQWPDIRIGHKFDLCDHRHRVNCLCRLNTQSFPALRSSSVNDPPSTFSGHAL
jgi:hypothetical protein